MTMNLVIGLTRGLPTVLPLTAALALLGGCDGNHYLGRNAGAGGAAGNKGGDDASAAPQNVVVSGTDAGPTAAPDGAESAPEVGPLGPSSSWTGYLENYQFLSGSDAVKLTFASDAAGLVVGKVTLGMGTPPPPATDPTAPYPPNLDPTAEFQQAHNYVGEGFDFSMQRGTFSATHRLRFTLLLNELWSSYCAIQKRGDDLGSCLPNGGRYDHSVGCILYGPDDQQLPVSCVQFVLCGSAGAGDVCTCSGQIGEECVFNPEKAASFDIAFAGDQGNGSTTGTLGDHNVRLTRDP